MNSNIVKIISDGKSGTGVLLSCEYVVKNNKDPEKYNYFLVLTCCHVVDSIEKKPLFEIVNGKGEILGKEDYIFVDESSLSKKLVYRNESGDRNDIKAYLIKISAKHDIIINHIIPYKKVLSNQIKVCTLGYPGILSDEKTANSISLDGTIADIKIKKKNIKAYILERNITWYVDLSQKNQLEGFSGGPVYKEVENQKFLIGINQSIPKLEDGNNPYSVVYYIEIDYVLSYLRDIGCLIHEPIDNNCYKIKWINDRKNDSIDKTILVIGGSGAGKSSFIRSFSKHGDLVDSSGDGQTTRMDIVYEFLLSCVESRIKINFMDENSFSKKMVQGLHKSIISLFLFEYYNLDETDLDSAPLSCMKKLYIPLDIIVKNLKKKKNCSKITEELDSLLMNIEHFLLIDDILEWELIVLYIDLIKVLDELFNNKEQYGFENKDHYIYYFNESRRKELFNQVKDLYILNESIGIYKKSDNDLINQLYFSGKLRYICKYEYEKINQKEYLEIIYEIGEIFKNNCRDVNNEKELHNQIESQEKRIVNFFNNRKGYFFISELNFLKCEEEISYLTLQFVRENFFSNNFLNPANYLSMFKESEESETKIHEFYKKIFSVAYSNLEKYTQSQLDIQIKNKRVELYFENSDKKIKEFIAMCLKNVKGKSLSGIVESVKITDMISDDYAFLFDELGINGLRFVDTCGLDHIEKGRNVKRTLEDTFDRNKDSNIKFDAVIYVKKLDSGRPTELENILPLIFEVEPNIALYSVFTGIDILYGSWNKFKNILVWDDKANDDYPKSVNYLLSNEGKKDIQKNLICRDRKKNLIYSVFTRNIIAYCSKNHFKNEVNPFRESNKINIKKLLKSIIIKEHNIIEIINEKELKNIIEVSNFNDELSKSIVKIFERASIDNWQGYHHMILKANARRINGEVSDEEILGFWGAYRNRWDQLFIGAYKYVFSVQNEELLASFDKLKSVDKIESIISNLRDDFFGDDKNLFWLKLDDNDKSEFRKILEKMYSGVDKNGKPIYKNNPFNENGKTKEYLGKSKEKSCEYLADVVNFKKGLEGISSNTKTFLNEFVDLFKSTLIKKIKSENKDCIRNFKRINPNIVVSLNETASTVHSFFCCNSNLDTVNDRFYSGENLDELIKYFISKWK